MRTADIAKAANHRQYDEPEGQRDARMGNNPVRFMVDDYCSGTREHEAECPKELRK